MKTNEVPHQKVRLTPRLPRVVLKANSHSGHQDQRDQEARSSWDPPSERSYRETWNNAVDYRILVILLSTLEQQDTNRQNKVKKLIEKFENHQPAQGILPSRLEPDAEDQRVQKESQDLIAEMNNTEIFELCENSSKKQCSDYNSYWKSATTTSPQSLAKLLRRVAVAVPKKWTF